MGNDINKDKIPRNTPNPGGKRPILRKLEDIDERNEDDTNKWKYIPCSWIKRILIVKMSPHPKAIQRLDAISIKIPMEFFWRTRTKNSKMCIET